MFSHSLKRSSARIRALSVFLILALLLQITQPILAQSEEAPASNQSMLSQGLKEFGNSFSGVGTPSWLLTKFGVQMGYHLIDCATKKEKPDVIKVVKSMATADYMARTAGGLLGGAAGSIFIPFLSAVPVFGGFLADFVPTFTCYLGANMAGEGLKGLKEGNFSFKNYFKTLDWAAMAAGSLGWSVGSLLGSAIIPPIGSIVGGMLGDLVATRLLDKFRKWKSGDNSPPLMPTGTGGPIRNLANRPVKSALAPKASVSADSQVSGQVSAAKPDDLMALSADYERLYQQYIRLSIQKKSEELVKVGIKMNEIKSKIEKAREK